jgi:hypothetical protein
MTIVSDSLPPVQTGPAFEAYRAHINSPCRLCAGGHFCSTLDVLDWLAAREASRD